MFDGNSPGIPDQTGFKARENIQQPFHTRVRVISSFIHEDAKHSARYSHVQTWMGGGVGTGDGGGGGRRSRHSGIHWRQAASFVRAVIN